MQKQKQNWKDCIINDTVYKIKYIRATIFFLNRVLINVFTVHIVFLDMIQSGLIQFRIRIVDTLK